MESTVAPASDGEGPRRSGKETYNRPGKATHWVAYYDTAWHTCRHRRVGRVIAAASTSLMHRV